MNLLSATDVRRSISAFPVEGSLNLMSSTKYLDSFNWFSVQTGYDFWVRFLISADVFVVDDHCLGFRDIYL